MRKGILILCAMMCVLAAEADTKSSKVLQGLKKTLSGKNYEAQFTLKTAEQGVEGSYVVNGDKFYMNVPSLGQMFCDGRTLYQVQEQNKVVAVLDVDPNEHAIFANPAKAFDFADGMFEHSYLGESRRDGALCDEVLLKMADADNSMTIRLFVNKANSLPVALCYSIGWDEEVWVDVSSIKMVKPSPATKFTINRKDYKGYEFIDFR